MKKLFAKIAKAYFLTVGILSTLVFLFFYITFSHLILSRLLIYHLVLHFPYETNRDIQPLWRHKGRITLGVILPLKP